MSRAPEDRKRTARPRLMGCKFDTLEARVMMSVVGGSDSPAPQITCTCAFCRGLAVRAQAELAMSLGPTLAPPVASPVLSATAPGGTAFGPTVPGGPDGDVQAANPLAPAPFSSNPTAPVKLYLNFTGEASTIWAFKAVPATPAFSLDGDTTTFTSAEISAMNEILSSVAEKYSPFNIDVTNIDPGSYDDRVAMKVVIGGSGSWLGQAAGGVAEVGSFYNSSRNIAWVFPSQLANTAKYIAEAAAHEAGHTFGLQHQATWNGNTLQSNYNSGDSSRAPIMGSSYFAARGLWWNGTIAVTSSTMQDDLSVLSNGNNAFGYRADDHGNTTVTATSLVFSGDTGAASGVITQTSDLDVFRFTTAAAGTVTIGGAVAQYGTMLDMTLELWSASGSLIASAATSALAETLSQTLASGTYYAVVKSAGNYGDIGQYSLSVTVPSSSLPTAPVAGVGGPYAVAEGGTVALSAAASTGTSLTYDWDLDGDGVYGETGTGAARGNETGVGVTFDAAGLDGPSTFNARLRVTDSAGQTATLVVPVSVTDVAPVVALSGATTGSEGSPATINFTATDVAGDPVTSWVVTWGDGTTNTYAGTATSATRTYADNGTYTVRVTAVNKDASAVQTRTLTIANVAPTISTAVSAPGGAREGSPLTLSWSATDPGTDTISAWKVEWGDGSTSNYAGNITSAAKTYLDNGTYTVRVTATDEDGTYATTTSVAVANVAPTLNLPTPSGLTEGTPFTLTWSATDPGTDTISAWKVEWGDGSTSTFAGNVTSAAKTYNDHGTYTVRLTATDEDGSYATTAALSVANVAPTLTLPAPTGLLEGTPFTLTWSATDPGTDTVSAWKVEWGDGSTSTFAGNVTSAAKTYNDHGNYTVRLTATDEDSSYSTTTALTVANVAPTLAITAPSNLKEGTPFTLSWSATDPGTDTVSAWKVEWGDGSTSTFAGNITSAAKSYADNGTYTVRLTATDEDGSYVTSSSLAIGNVAPTVGYTVPADVREGTPFTLNWTATDPGTDTLSQWRVTWGDGSTSTFAGSARSASKQYADNGTYQATLTAFDEDGSYYQTLPVAVANVAPTITLATSPTPREGSPLTLTVGVADPGADAVSTWKIEWGDRSTSAYAGSPSSVSKTYSTAGTYPLRVTVTDEDGSYVTTGSVTVASSAPPVVVSAPSVVGEGTPFTLAWSAGASAGTVSQWQVDWGDGTTGTFAGNVLSAVKTYADDGGYAVRVTATGTLGTFDAAASISVTNAAPTLTLAAPAGLREGTAFTLAWSAADPGTDTISAWKVDWGDGTTGTFAGNISSAGKTYADNGTYTVRLTATDEDGSYATTSALSVANVAPTLTLSAPSGLTEGTLFTLVWSAADAGTDTITQYRVEWGDGTTGTFAGSVTSAAKMYADDGTYTVRLVATDEDSSYTTTTVANVADIAPTLTLTAPTGLREGTAFTLGWTAADPGADGVTQWRVDWGDGTTSTFAGSVTSAPKTYAASGGYTVRLTAVDQDGTYQLSRDLTVADVPPALSIALSIPLPATPAEGAAFQLVPTAVDPGNDPVRAWSIDWGNGTTSAFTGPLAPVTYTYPDDGTYTVRLTVTQDAGTFSTDRAVVVANVAPTLTAAASAGPRVGQPTTLTLSASDPGRDAVSAWRIDWGDGSTPLTLAGTATSASHVYAAAGGYTVRATATDDDGTWAATPVGLTVAGPVTPAAGLQMQASVLAGRTESATLSFSDPLGRTAAGWTIDWGDGTTDTLTGPAALAPVSHRFAAAGTYTVTARLRLQDLTEATASLVVTAVASADAVRVAVPALVLADADARATLTLSAPADRAHTGWSLDWGDGTVVTLPADATSAAHRYAPGTYAVRVASLGADGDAVWSAPAGVRAVAAAPTVTAPKLVRRGAAVTAAFAVSPDAASLVTGWVADWGDGTVETLPGDVRSLVHRFGATGTYTLTLTARSGETAVPAATRVSVWGRTGLIVGVPAAPIVPQLTSSRNALLTVPSLGPVDAEDLTFTLRSPTGRTIPAVPAPASADGSFVLAATTDRPAWDAADAGEWTLLADDGTGTAEVDTFTLTPPTGTADLAVASATLTARPATLLPGSELRATARVTLGGTGFSGATRFAYFLSADALWDPSDTPVSATDVRGKSGQTKSVSSKFRLPADLAPGSYRLLAVADAAGTTAEADEQNNVREVAALTVVAPLIDFSTSTFSRAPARDGSLGTVRLLLRNSGNTAASALSVRLVLRDASGLDTPLSTTALGKSTVAPSKSLPFRLTSKAAVPAGSVLVALIQSAGPTPFATQQIVLPT